MDREKGEERRGDEGDARGRLDRQEEAIEQQHRGEPQRQTEGMKDGGVRTASRGPGERPDRLRDGAIELQTAIVGPVSRFPNVGELAERVDVQALVVHQDDAVIEDESAGQCAEIGEQESGREP